MYGGDFLVLAIHVFTSLVTIVDTTTLTMQVMDLVNQVQL